MRRGYSLPLVLVVLTVLATTITVMTFVLAASAKSTGAVLGRRDSLYACDGMARGLSIKARDYFQTTSVPDAASLRLFLCGLPGQCAPAELWIPGYTLDDVSVSTKGTNVIGEVSTGPFRGQSARRTDMTISVAMTKTATGQRCEVTQSLVNSEIGLFQFAVFSSIYMDLFPGPAMEIEGRVHVNGDFCAHPMNVHDLIVGKVTASGRILTHDCPRAIEAPSSGKYFIRDNDSASTPRQLLESQDGDEAGWRAFALSTWHGNAQDSSHGVPNLRLPVATGAQTQAGKDASGVTITNENTLRLLIDAPRSSDSPEGRAEKFAEKADIRIINGVWYKKNGSSFPGTVIWSDHPVDIVTSADEQDLGVPTNIPASTTFPLALRYSQYELSGGLVAGGGPESVVSYGGLKKDGSAWKPGFISGGGMDDADDAGELTKASRTGFVDFRVERGNPGNEAHAHILPLNFDVKAFIEALKDNTNTELGEHFAPGTFNGIVWIGNTWPNSQAGFPGGLAGPPPNVTATSAQLEAASVPYPLCGGVATTELAHAGTNIVQQAPCTVGMPRPNAVRVFHADDIDEDVVPNGLTIASNGPVYVLGKVNTSSLSSGVPGTPRKTGSGPWVPFLVAGDAVSLLSNDWTDSAHLYNKPYANIVGACTVDTVDTTYVMSILSGHVETSMAKPSGGINNFPRFAECWNNTKTIIHGSMVIGFRSIFQYEPWDVTVYHAPIREWHYDNNLANPANQPPGSPSFFVQAIVRWDRM